MRINKEESIIILLFILFTQQSRFLDDSLYPNLNFSAQILPAARLFVFRTCHRQYALLHHPLPHLGDSYWYNAGVIVQPNQPPYHQIPI